MVMVMFVVLVRVMLVVVPKVVAFAVLVRVVLVHTLVVPLRSPGRAEE